MKTLYGLKSGQDIKVIVAVPVIANPTPQKSGVTWIALMKKNHHVASILSQQGVQTLVKQFYCNHRSKLFWKLHPEVQYDRSRH